MVPGGILACYDMPLMKLPPLLWLLLAIAILAMGLAIYRSRYPRSPGIDPRAAEEIHKAQKR